MTTPRIYTIELIYAALKVSPLTSRELVAHLDKSMPAVSSAVGRMKRGGFVHIRDWISVIGHRPEAIYALGHAPDAPRPARRKR